MLTFHIFYLLQQWFGHIRRSLLEAGRSPNVCDGLTLAGDGVRQTSGAETQTHGQ